MSINVWISIIHHNFNRSLFLRLEVINRMILNSVSATTGFSQSLNPKGIHILSKREHFSPDSVVESIFAFIVLTTV